MRWFRRRECINAPYCDNPNDKCSRNVNGCEFTDDEIFKQVLIKEGLPENISIAEYQVYVRKKVGEYISNLRSWER